MIKQFLLLSLLLLSNAVFAESTFSIHPDMEPHRSLYLSPEKSLPHGELKDQGVYLQYFGVASTLITDGETSIMIDGFFSRPKISTYLSVQPKVKLITSALKQASIKSLDAVLVVHSHFDHAMDSPEVAKQTGAKVYGSASTANISRGWGLAEEKIVEVKSKQAIPIGDFSITFIKNNHYPFPFGLSRFLLGKKIKEPLVPPTFVGNYEEGGSYSILIEHKLGTILVHGSAGFIANQLNDYKADVVLLGVGGLAAKAEQYKEDYLNNIVITLGAKTVIPIHWDKMDAPFGAPLIPAKGMTGGIHKIINHYQAPLAERNISLRLLPEWETVKVF